MGKEELRMADSTGSTYRIEAVVSVDERGQMVLPKELRQRAGIGAGGKLALVAFEDKGEICCISFFKVDDLSGMVRDKLGPVMQGALGS
ncbi:MAG: HgcAB-associated protein [Chloroflexi bacterium]|nr:HgcAB-associated protein [Chloroflexota bacterium]MDA1174172.1 HgcAB-associated protein [Chloroflexota bacterium]